MTSIPMTRKPCPRCRELFVRGAMRGEAVMPLPKGAFAPMAEDKPEKVCLDCGSAFTLMRTDGLSFIQARVAVANNRQESFRLPGAPLGLIGTGHAQVSIDEHHEWLDAALPGWDA